MNITSHELQTLISTLQDMSQPTLEFEVRSDYSGRGMYGKTCLGFVTDRPLELHGAICAILAEDAGMCLSDGTDLNYSISWWDLRPQTDGMGLSSILYYSNLTVDQS